MDTLVPSLKLTGFALFQINGWIKNWPANLAANSARKTNMTMEHHHFLIGDTSSNGCVFIVMLVFWG